MGETIAGLAGSVGAEPGTGQSSAEGHRLGQHEPCPRDFSPTVEWCLQRTVRVSLSSSQWGLLRSRWGMAEGIEERLVLLSIAKGLRVWREDVGEMVRGV